MTLTEKDSVNVLPKVVRFIQILRFSSTENADRVVGKTATIEGAGAGHQGEPSKNKSELTELSSINKVT